MDNEKPLTCPFCGFVDSSDYQMMYHVEVYHSEDGDSPFAVRDALAASATEETRTQTTTPTDSADSIPVASAAEYIDCPHKCGERVTRAELRFHTDLHLAEDIAVDDAVVASAVGTSSDQSNDSAALESMSNAFDTSIAAPIRNYDSVGSSVPPQYARRKALSLKELFFGMSPRTRRPHKSSQAEADSVRRLGKAELGPYAHEDRMPSWLQKMLEDGAKVTMSNKIGPSGNLIRVETIANETPHLVPVLARLSAIDRRVARAFYCAPEVRHIAKMRREGGFCGYRNIQMLLSYIRGVKAPGYQHFLSKLPSILDLQELIEMAWDQGYNSSARIETGGIRLTRKYIGTPEAQALCSSLGISCQALGYSGKDSTQAYTSLMQAVFEHFDDGQDRSEKVVITQKPPLYFQHKGHSMTIVGVEVQQDGRANLVVFDPMFNPSPAIKKLTDAPSLFRCSDPARLLKAHRRGESYLAKYKDFEILKVSSGTSEG